MWGTGVIWSFYMVKYNQKISDFKSLAIQALQKASEKGRAKYRFACTRTLEEEEKILSWISNYDPDQLISISKE